MNYQINVISLCGAVKQMEYEHEDEEDIHNINMHRFANVIYDKMNDDNIPIGFQRGRISNEIIELARIVETLEFKNCQEPHPGDRRDYYIIIGVDENRYAVHVGCGVYPCYQTDELPRAINEYLETTTGQILN